VIEMRDDDAFWAARRVAAFSDDMIRAIIHTGECYFRRETQGWNLVGLERMPESATTTPVQRSASRH
jgi:hypothetical protein